MIEVRFAASERIWDELCLSLSLEEESAAIVLAGRALEDDRLTLCLNRIIWVPDAEYEERTPTHLKISSSGWMPALGQAARSGWQPIFFHTHPGAPPTPSRADCRVAKQLAPVFYARSGAAYASLIVGGTPDEPSFSGTYGEGEVAAAIERVRVVGRRLRVMSSADASKSAQVDLSTFDRQVRAFGPEGQQVLGGLRVGIAGGGGTGSAVFEQLVRLGIGTIVTVDDDRVTDKNVTRIYGSTMSDIGRPKVEVLAAHADRIGLGTEVVPVDGKVTELPGFTALRGCDIVFGCTDDNAGRAVLSRLAYWYCLPVIDMGVLITTAEHRVNGLFERLTVMGPGMPCLFCRGRIDVNAMREEALPEDERRQLVQEGYAQGLGDPDPSVVAYTTMVASLAVDEFLQRLFGFGDDDPADELLVRVPEREIRRLSGSPVEGHFCADRSTHGRADREPPLDTMWA